MKVIDVITNKASFEHLVVTGLHMRNVGCHLDRSIDHVKTSRHWYLDKIEWKKSGKLSGETIAFLVMMINTYES